MEFWLNLTQGEVPRQVLGKIALRVDPAVKKVLTMVAFGTASSFTSTAGPTIAAKKQPLFLLSPSSNAPFAKSVRGTT
jgi:hypothetical protein